MGCSPWGRKELDMTERLHFHFLLSCVGEGNGNPLRCSCLENLRDRGAWWAAVYAVAQSWTRLKRLSCSNSMHCWWEWKLVQPLQKRVWEVPQKNLKSELPYDQTVLLLGMYLVIHLNWKGRIAAVFTIAKTWKQPKRPLTDGWIQKM